MWVWCRVEVCVCACVCVCWCARRAVRVVEGGSVTHSLCHGTTFGVPVELGAQFVHGTHRSARRWEAPLQDGGVRPVWQVVTSQGWPWVRFSDGAGFVSR